jgi:ribonucleoside-diphosphate reductase alpha chain
MTKMLSKNAITILNERYLHGDSIENWLKRIAQHIANEPKIDKTYEEEEEKEYVDDFNMMGINIADTVDKSDANIDVFRNAYAYAYVIGNMLFMPNTPCLANAGRPMGQLAACFVLPIADDLCNSDDSIFATLRNAAAIQQTGGGVGFDFSELRPAGDVVASSGGTSSGPISFLRIYDAAFNGIRQGGMRRGACMAILRVDHPDIEAFIDCKHGEGSITNFNISVAITDEFMNAVQNDAPFELRNRAIVRRTINARALMRKIAECTWRNGEPGLVFIDAVNRANPVPNVYNITATNPCGEQALGPYENCALGHINLARMMNECARSIDMMDEIRYTIDFNSLRRITRTGVCFLDQLVDRNTYVSAVPKLRECALKTRRIGLGITGLADMFVKLDITYGSNDSASLARDIMLYIRYHAIAASNELARKYGPFPAIVGSNWDTCNIDKTMEPLRTAIEHMHPSRSDIAQELRELHDHLIVSLRECGVRNACMISVAPTGTTSLILGTLGYGCEPIYSHSYERTLGDGSKMQFNESFMNKKIENLYRRTSTIAHNHYTLESFQRALSEHGGPNAFIEHDSIHINEMRAINATALNIDPKSHIRVQAALQEIVDNGISKTVNCPFDTTVDDILEIYMNSWKMNLKGLALYRTGSRNVEVLVATNTAQANVSSVAQANVSSAAQANVKRARPSIIPGFTYKIDSCIGRVHTTVNFIDGAPFEVFVNASKSGTEVYADSEAIGRLISTILRMQSDILPAARIAEIIEQLRGIGGSRTIRDQVTKRAVASLPDAVAISLEALCTDQQNASATSILHNTLRDICPSCHTANLIRVEGCNSCTNCGYSAC